MKTIQRYIFEQVAEKKLAQEDAKIMLQELLQTGEDRSGDFAIIGMAGKLPGADNVEQYWENILDGKSSICDFPSNRWKDGYPNGTQSGTIYNKGGYLDEIDKFDSLFFNISPQEAKFMNPVQRKLLETAYEAVEDSGYGGQRIVGTNTGVYIGVESSSIIDYTELFPQDDTLMFTGNMNGILASRIAYQLNLNGPSIVVDTACSSSLTALIMGCQAMNSGQCEQAIIGGVCLKVGPTNQTNVLNMVESDDGLIKTFDQEAGGTSWGEAVGAIIVKPLEKAKEAGDSIYAVIKGYAINNDGTSNGIAAPNAKAQEDVIVKAWENAKIDPTSIQYIETHGTGTKLGDPIEIKGITDAFRRFTNKRQFCAVGSVKTAIGHTIGASGMASIIKVAMMLKNRKIPKTLNFNRPNQFINFIDSPVYVNDRLIPWEKGENARRAGISAFGFSGTNCHIILEEAPATVKEDISQKDKFHMFTISAKTKEGLVELVKRYRDFFLNHQEIDLSDLCYTASIGRGHYEYRIALMFETMEELIEKLEYMSSADVEQINKAGIYYGEHQVASSQQEVFEKNEITEEQKNILSENAEKEIEKYMLTKDQSILEKLCKDYISGVDLDWKKMYQDENCKIVNLPTYPYQKIRCWSTKVISLDQIGLKKKIRHPFVDCCAIESACGCIYTTTFSAARHWILREHKVNNHYTLPGITYIEMAGELGRQKRLGDYWEVKDLVFLQPLVVDDEKEVHSILQKNGEAYDYSVSSKTGDQWVKHAQGKICPLKKAKPKKVDLDELVRRCTCDESKQEIKDDNNFIEVGHRWDVNQNIRFGEGEILAFLKLPTEYLGDMDNFYLYPTMLDIAMNEALHRIGDGSYLPWGYKSIKVYAKIPSEVYSYCKRKDQGEENAKAATYDITVFDKQGNVIIETTGYTIKKVEELRQGDYEEQKNVENLYKIGWVEEELKKEAKKASTGCTLVLRNESVDNDIYTRGLRNLGQKVIEVSVGESYQKIDENTYIVPINEESYANLMANFVQSNLTRIIHLQSMDYDEVETKEQFEQAQQRGVMSLFYLTRALLKNRYTQQLDLVLVGNNVNEVTKEEMRLNPFPAALFGLGQVVGQEYKKLSCRSIDLDQDTDPLLIFDELVYGNEVGGVAYRHGKRYVKEFQALEPDEIPENQIEFHEDGVYIITGGMGGLGLEFSKYIASKKHVNLALFNRSKLPERAQWKEILDKNENSKLVNKILTIQAMEAKGATVNCYSVDISNEESLKAALDELRNQYGKIRGIIQSAGVAGDGFIINKDYQVFESVLKPKMNGTWLLDQLTQQDNLDFFILFSSIAAFLGGRGQGDYSAANSYMDAFAAYRNRTGKKSLSINWPAWKETGMAVDHSMNTDGLFQGISTADALHAFEKVATTSANQVIIAEIDWKTVGDGDFPMKTSCCNMEMVAPQIKSNVEEHRSEISNQIKLTGRSNMAYTPMEQSIADIWGKVLGITTVNIFDNFERMGGNSILAINLLNEIDLAYPDMAGVADVFTYSSVNKFAEFLTQKIEAKKEEEKA